MNRAEWEEAYAKRMVERGIETGEAAALATTGADNYEQDEGPDVDQWDDPAEAADEELSCWGD